jgi:hypothetical protein
MPAGRAICLKDMPSIDPNPQFFSELRHLRSGIP